MLVQLGQNLFCLEDTCNVYVVRCGDASVLIDFGSGDVLDRLDTLGIQRVEAVLMTHHHRDQGQGLARAAEMGIPIWVPHQEQDLFLDVEAHWQSREIYANYNMRQDRFSLLGNVPVAGTLRDYAVLRFVGHDFAVLPTPGHTIGSISLLLSGDEGPVVFSGDLIAAPGKVWSLAATQWTYSGAEGAAASIASLLDLRDRRPAMLLPSHGAPIRDPGPAIDLLVSRLHELLDSREENGRLFSWRAEPYLRVAPHVLWNRTSLAYSYVLLSESGKALLIDYGYDFFTGHSAGADRAAHRPSLYTIETLKRDFGVTRVDVVIPTHYHDDHVAGCNLLREVEATQVWAPARFARVLEHPGRYDLPCLWYDPVPVDRVLPLGFPISWEEYSLELYAQPGHTRHAAAIVFAVDGYRFMASGDQYSGGRANGWNYVYQNGFHSSDYRASAALYRSVMPDVILPGHWEPFHVDPGYVDRLEMSGDTLERLHRDLLPLEDYCCDAGGVCAWLRPYQATLSAGQWAEFEVEVLNPYGEEAEARLSVVTPALWQAHERELTLVLPAHGARVVRFRLAAPQGTSVRRGRVAVDVTIAGHRLGQQAEALITVYQG